MPSFIESGLEENDSFKSRADTFKKQDCRELVDASKKIVPKMIPAGPIVLSSWDATMLNWPGVTIVNVLDSPIDVQRMEMAMQSLVNANPILAGRLGGDEKNGFVVKFSSESGAIFTVKNMDNEAVQTLSRASPSLVPSKIIEWLPVTSKLVSFTADGHTQLNNADAPLTTLVITQGTELCTVSLSVSHMIADGWVR